jgi:glucose/arabinose dehydrogenase
MAVRAGDPSLYIAEQGGRIMALRNGRVDSQPVLDLSGQISAGGEQGLLGLAFSPDGRFLYVNFTDQDGNTNVDELQWGDQGPLLGSTRRVLFVEQPAANHNGGNLAFGPEGDLYIGLGDGGGEGDPFGTGQSLGSLLGKMLRIDPRPSGGRPYGIPPANPFVGRSGARPEIWAYGLRNPWRYSFDRETGDLWIGDVGGSQEEEVDFQRAGSGGGQNYGWNRLEGTKPFQGSAPPNAVPPVYEYTHDNGCVVTGGYVYRGPAIPALEGAYVFADFCRGRIMGLRMIAGRARVRFLGPTLESLSSFGEDQDGELYALSLTGGVFKLTPP